jgi:low affinity Fe/Cu permease
VARDASHPVEEGFARFAGAISRATGHVGVFSAAILLVVAWAATGPLFDFSETWQLVINTGTTIITFLMVFVIQHSQNKDMMAVQLKLDELIAAVHGASNELIDAEDLSDHELARISARFKALARKARALDPGAPTSIEASHGELHRGTKRRGSPRKGKGTRR